LASISLNVRESWPISSPDWMSTGVVTGVASFVRSPSETATRPSESTTRQLSLIDWSRAESACTGRVTERVI